MRGWAVTNLAFPFFFFVAFFPAFFPPSASSLSSNRVFFFAFTTSAVDVAHLRLLEPADGCGEPLWQLRLVIVLLEWVCMMVVVSGWGVVESDDQLLIIDYRSLLTTWTLWWTRFGKGLRWHWGLLAVLGMVTEWWERGRVVLVVVLVIVAVPALLGPSIVIVDIHVVYFVAYNLYTQ